MHEEKRKGEIQMAALEKAEKIKQKNCETEKGRNKEQMVLCKKMWTMKIEHLIGKCWTSPNVIS